MLLLLLKKHATAWRLVSFVRPITVSFRSSTSALSHTPSSWCGSDLVRSNQISRLNCYRRISWYSILSLFWMPKFLLKSSLICTLCGSKVLLPVIPFNCLSCFCWFHGWLIELLYFLSFSAKGSVTTGYNCLPSYKFSQSIRFRIISGEPFPFLFSF